ncbi:MAG: MATE family efflux transporter [Gemmatimonadales bacterium]|nr:MATE family efflux transporter [Gemmatimonadales bacterium]
MLLLAVPMVVEMMMESLFAVTDAFFVAKLGADAVATVGLSESLLTIVYTVAMGLSIAVTSTVARHVGAGDRDAAARAAVQGIVAGLAIAIVLSALGIAYAPELLRLMGASEAVIRTGTGFTRVLLGGEATVILLFLINAAFRGAGDAAVAMRVLIVSNVLNIVLDPLLIFGIGPFPELGVTGAAVATTTGRGVGVLLQLWVLLRGAGRLRVRRAHLVPDGAVLRALLALAGPATLQVFIGTASWIGLTRVLAPFGSAALAGYTIGIRIVIFAILPAVGVANAAATMVGQALGARKPERAEQAAWLACRYNLAFLGVLGLVFVLAARPLVAVFTRDDAVASVAVDTLRIIAAGFPFYAFGMVLTEAFNGAGDTLTPTLINLGVFWLFEIPFAWVLAVRTPLGPRGVFLAITLAFSTLAVVSALLFRRGGWKRAPGPAHP